MTSALCGMVWYGMVWHGMLCYGMCLFETGTAHKTLTKTKQFDVKLETITTLYVEK